MSQSFGYAIQVGISLTGQIGKGMTGSVGIDGKKWSNVATLLQPPKKRRSQRPANSLIFICETYCTQTYSSRYFLIHLEFQSYQGFQKIHKISEVLLEASK
jgi:hypothetical protein